jgi:hypothetical protein
MCHAEICTYVAVNLKYAAEKVIYTKIKSISLRINNRCVAEKGKLNAIKRMNIVIEHTYAAGKLTIAEIICMSVRIKSECVAANRTFFAVKRRCVGVKGMNI